MGLLQAPDLGLGIASSLGEIVRGRLQFILVQLQLGLGDLYLILQRILLGFLRRSQLPGEPGDELLIDLDGGLGLRLDRKSVV